MEFEMVIHSSPVAINQGMPDPCGINYYDVSNEYLAEVIRDDVHWYDPDTIEALQGSGGGEHSVSFASRCSVRGSRRQCPFSGDLKGGIWNAQGLFHSKASKQQEKWRRLFRIMHGKDFWIVYETHSNPAKVLAFQEKLTRLGYRAFWTHGTNRRAGVGILVKHMFLASFTAYGRRANQQQHMLVCFHLL